MRLWLLALVVVVGCGESEPIEADAGIPDAGPTVQIDWEPCPLYTGGTGTDAECATLEVPALWDEPEGETITVFVKRAGSDFGSGRQLWLLSGGPGQAGLGWEDDAEAILARDPTVDIYIPDHRGTGRSSRLDCDFSNLAGCIASLDGAYPGWPQIFTTTHAARDVGWLIQQTRAPGQEVNVHGKSYGSFWTQRYLQVFPDQATSASMLGVTRPAFSFTEYDIQYEQVGELFMNACAADPTCAAAFGQEHPYDVMRDTMDNLGLQCPAVGLDRATLRRFFGIQLLWEWHQRVLIPTTIARIRRCNAEDQVALDTLMARIPSLTAEFSQDGFASNVINVHVIMSELWEAPIPTSAQAQALLNNGLFAQGIAGLIGFDQVWPLYPEDEYADVYAQTSIPVLVLNGDLDPATPDAQVREVGDHFDGPNQHFVNLPDATHRWTSPTSEGTDCAFEIFMDWLADPFSPFTDCTTDMVAVDFTEDAALAARAYGTTTLWGAD